jgi:pimeloyl-ACP methyl ester carboxylesterase
MSRLAPLLVLLLLVPSCRTPVGVERVDAEKAYAELRGDALSTGRASIGTRQLLERHDLLERFEDDPDATLLELQGIASAERDRGYLVALAELSYLRAVETGSRERFLTATICAWLSLYGESLVGEFDAYDPRFRLACDLYNASLTEFLRGPDGDVVFAGGSFDLPGAHVELTATKPTFLDFEAEPGTKLLPAVDFQLRGLRVRNRRSGVGVALIAARPPARRVMPVGPRTPIAVRTANALLRVTENRFEPAPDGRSGAGTWSFRGVLELSDPNLTPTAEISGRSVPLESDLSATIAYALQRSRVWEMEISGFFSGEIADYEPGLVFCSPYQPGQIPVVLVHGTASSPARWAEMFNGLAADPRLLQRFQLWLFTYNTGNAVQYSRWLLRKALDDAIARFDPEGKDEALRHMVLIGHSQGGLLTKLMIVDSGEVFWNQMKSKGVDPEKLDAEKQKAVRDIAVFEHAPYVDRVIFLATPFRGSFQAGRWYSRLAGKLISLPADVLAISKNLLTANLLSDDEMANLIPTSVGQMDPESDFVRLLGSLPIAPGVKAHSIVAVEGDGPVEAGNDGVVEWKSAHLDGATSELVVRCDHSCQSNPLAIVEVRRILLEQLAAVEAAAKK